MVAKEHLSRRGNIFETDLSFVPNQVLRCIGDVTAGLLGKARERDAFWLDLDNAAQLATNEQRIVHRPRCGLKFADRDAKPGAEVQIGPRLDQPTARDKAPVDQRPGFVLGMEG